MGDPLVVIALVPRRLHRVGPPGLVWEAWRPLYGKGVEDDRAGHTWH